MTRKHHRVLLLAWTCLTAALLWGPARAAPEGVAIGDIRAVLSKTGAPVRERPSALARATVTLPHATRVRIVELRGDWARITPLGSPTESSGTGWLRASQTVEPFALTQAGRGGPVAVRDTPTETDLSAAGRQFDEVTESTYRATRVDLPAAYVLVDWVEAATPDPETVRQFVLAGRLGRPEEGE